MVSRREFFAALAGLPFVRKLLPTPKVESPPIYVNPYLTDDIAWFLLPDHGREYYRWKSGDVRTFHVRVRNGTWTYISGRT